MRLQEYKKQLKVKLRPVLPKVCTHKNIELKL